METESGAFHPTRFSDIAVTVDFHCNSACRFCIVQEGMNRYDGVPFERFREMVDQNGRDHRYDRVIFTGGEVTLEKKLFKYIEHARESGSFEHLRVQTHGRRLADPEFARTLVDAGVDELFISLHGHDSETHDWITQRPGSFDELLAGLANVAPLPVTVITNTVMVTANLSALSPIVDVVHRHGVKRMEFWNYLPMEDYVDERGLIAPMADLLPALHAALERCAENEISAVTKYVPRCRLGVHADTLDNGQPDVVIVESFWDAFPKFSCLYEAVCEHSGACLGLHHPYVNKYGWEEETLRPAPRTTPWTEQDEIVEGRPDDGGEARPRSGHAAWEALLQEVPREQGSIERVQLTRNQARFTMALPDGGGRLDLVLVARDDDAPALRRTRSFNVFYTNASGASPKEAVAALLSAACESVDHHDRGDLSLDPRKGLVQISSKHDRRG